MPTYVLSHPYSIGPRLMPSLELSDGSRVSIEAGVITAERRVRWDIIIDDAEGNELYNDDSMTSGCGHDPSDVADAFESFASFVGAWVEALNYNCGESENGDLFPYALREWAEQNADELCVLTSLDDEDE